MAQGRAMTYTQGKICKVNVTVQTFQNIYICVQATTPCRLESLCQGHISEVKVVLYKCSKFLFRP